MEEKLTTLKRAYLFLVLVLFAVVALAFSVVVPFGEPSDEPAHYAYVRYLLEHRCLPVQNPDPTLNPVPEGHHPPGYYTVVALLTGWAPYGPYDSFENPYLPVGEDDPYIVQQFLHPAYERFPWQGPLLAAHLARLVSIGMGLFSIWVTYRISREVAPNRRYVALLAAATHAFVPQFVYMSSAINNDNAATLIGSLVTWQMLRLLRLPTNRGFVLLGGLMGLGVLSKASLLAMFGAIGWTVLFVVLFSPRDAQSSAQARVGDVLLKGVLVVAPLLLLSGWWIWRNLQLYGDPVGYNIWMVTNSDFARRLPISWEYAGRFWWQQFRTFWGLFGWSRVFLPLGLYIFWLVLTLLGVGGVLCYLLVGRRREQRARVILLVLVLAGFVLSTWRLGLSLDIVAAQGRFFFPALSAIATLLALGWLAWWPRRLEGRVTSLAIGVLLLLVVGVLSLRLVPVYARPIVPALPAEAQPVQASFEPWELVGWQAPPPVAGRQWPIRFYWRAQRELTPQERSLNPILFVHAVDAQGEILDKWDGVPTQGRFPPPAWSPDELAVDRVVLSLPDRAWPYVARLWVGFYFKKAEGLERVAVRSATHPTQPGTLVLGPVIARPDDPPPVEPEQPVEARFGPIRLLGFDLAPAQEDENLLRLVLYWRAEADVTANYTVFVHLVSADGQVIQGDAPPCGGACPTALWRAGDVWRDTHLLPTDSLSSEATPYTLSIGWYEPETGARLPAYSAQDSRYPDDQLVLCTFDTWPGACLP